MSDVSFRSPSTPEVKQSKPNIPEPKRDETHTEESVEDLEPVEDGLEAMLNALDINDTAKNLPETDKSNLSELTRYIEDLLTDKGLSKTLPNYKKQLGYIMDEMGLDRATEPQRILDRIGGVVKAWKSIVFVSDPKERKSLFMKLAKQPDSKAMDKLIFEEMERRKIWQ